MAGSKFVETNKKIEKTVTETFSKIENIVVGGYTKIENRFVEAYLMKDGETISEAKDRLRHH